MLRCAVMTIAALIGGISLALPGAEITNQGLAAAFHERFAVGAAIPGADLTNAEKDLLFANFSTVTPENCLKPQAVHPAENKFTFAQGDALIAMAHQHGLTVNGHTLIWHQSCPDWFFIDAGKPAPREMVLNRMRAHIAEVAGHFAGKVVSWDVVNEVIDDGKDYLRPSRWLTSIGEDYIAEAYFAAHRADPQAELYYNDYNIEYPNKRAKTLRLIAALKKQLVPLNGIGIQGHYQLDRIPFKEIEETILAFHHEGLKVMITELDLDAVPRSSSGADVSVKEHDNSDPYATGLPADVQQRLADQYAQLFALFLKHQDKISRVTFWGLHDGRTWLNSWPRKRTNHPLLWDRNLQPKPALASILNTEALLTKPSTKPSTK